MQKLLFRRITAEMLLLAVLSVILFFLMATPTYAQILGTTTTPGLPTTGFGGNATLNLLALTASTALMALSAYFLLRRRGA